MGKIIEFFANASQETLIDYAITIVTILLSFVAIWVSISTANKQNKIAMFDLRYNCISQIRTIISYENSIYSCEEPILVLCLLDALWGTGISDNIGYDEKIIKARCHQEVLFKEVMQVEYLFKGHMHTDLPTMLKCMQSVIMSAINGEIDEESRSNFHRQCCELYEKDLPRLLKQINCKKL